VFNSHIKANITKPNTNSPIAIKYPVVSIIPPFQF